MRFTLMLPWVLLASLMVACAGEEPVALRPAQTPVDAQGHMHPGPRDRCPVCAMSTEDKRMVSALQLQDGATYYFCGPMCMLQAWLEPQRHLGAAEANIQRAITREYFTGEPVDASEVLWIPGSDVSGPMGHMIVPVKGEDAAARFRERHGGAEPFRLEVLDAAMWKRITGPGAGR